MNFFLDIFYFFSLFLLGREQGTSMGEGSHHPMGQGSSIPMQGFHLNFQLGFLIGAAEESAQPAIPWLTWKCVDPFWVKQ